MKRASVLLSFLFLSATAGLVLPGLAASRPAPAPVVDRPVSAPPAEPAAATTRPATAPAEEPYPPKALAEAAEASAKRLRERLDDTFAFEVQAPFVIAGNMSARQLKAYASGSVLAPAKALWKGYFRRKPDQVITILLLADDKTYRAWAKKLFGDEDVAHFGYYRRDDRTLVMNISTGGGTLVHELTHALVVYDFPDQPTWFNEGLASLHEQCRIGADDITGLPNWRLPALQQAVRDKKLRPLRDLVTKRDFYGAERGMNYAQARYLCLYMQRKGLLKKFYAYFRDHSTGDDADVQAVEHVLGRRTEDIEKDFLAWIPTLRFP